MGLKIWLLGAASIEIDYTPIKLGGKSLALLAYLLVTKKFQTREHLMDLLFDEAADPRASLRWLVSDLRRHIGKEFLITNRTAVSFNFEREYWLDLNAFENGAFDLYQDGFLSGFHVRDARRFKEWLFFEQERIRLQCVNFMNDQVELLEHEGNFEEVILIAAQLLQIDNLKESWHRSLIQAYALMGNINAAMTQYRTLLRYLKDELGVEPEAETVALMQQIQAGSLSDPRSLAEIPIKYPPFLEQAQLKPEDKPLFVARSEEIEWLNQALTKALNGQGRISFVLGGAGRGKSALCHTFAERAQQSYPNLLVAHGNCNAFAGIGDPFLPFRDIFEMLTGNVESQVISGTINEEQARRLWGALLVTCQAILENGPNVLDVLVSRKELISRAKTAVPRHAIHLAQLRKLEKSKLASSGELKQEFLFQQVTNVLRAVAKRFPLLLLLDDLQWADATSISLLFHLGRRLGDARILIVGAYRPEEVILKQDGVRHPIQKLTSEFKRLFDDVDLDLGQTKPAENRHFVEAMIDSEPNALGTAFREALFQHTNGHPLFTVELMRAMQERGDLVQNEQGEWVVGSSLNWAKMPLQVQAVIEERISRLRSELREILTIASVDGEEFTAQVIALIQNINERELIQQLSQTLDRQHRLVQSQGEISVGQKIISRFRFAHILFQRYLYERLSHSEKRLFHREVGLILEQLFGEKNFTIAVHLARHFEIAKLDEKAAFYLHLAGEQAAKRYANEEAVENFNRAIELTSHSDLEQLFSLYLSRENIYHLRGMRSHQQNDLEILLDLAKRMANPMRVYEAKYKQARYFEAVAKFESLKQILHLLIEEMESHQLDEMHLKTELLRFSLPMEISNNEIETTINSLVQDANSLQLDLVEADAQWILGRHYISMGEFDKSEALFNALLPIYQNKGSLIDEAKTISGLAMVSSYQNKISLSLKHYKNALHLYRQIGDRKGEGRTLNNLGAVTDSQYDYEAAKTFYEMALAVMMEVEDKAAIIALLNNLSSIFIHLGDFGSGKSYIQEAIEIERALYGIDFGTLINFAWLSIHLEEFSIAQDYCLETIDQARARDNTMILSRALLLLGHILVEMTHFSAAVEAYEESLELRQNARNSPGSMPPRVGLALAFFKLGNQESASYHLEKVITFLETEKIQNIDEPYRLFLICYRVLNATNDIRAFQILRQAYQHLMNTAVKITNHDLRYSFLNNVVVNREIIVAYETFQQNQT